MALFILNLEKITNFNKKRRICNTMNIFFLSSNPIIAAMMMCDKHIIKMILESAQILSTVYCLLSQNYHYIDQGLVYGPMRNYINNPAVMWAMSSSANFQWLLTHAYALVREHVHRYNPKQIHKSSRIITFILDDFENIERLFKQHHPTPPALIMPKECMISKNAVACYRYFYRHDKQDFAEWKKTRSRPDWWSKVPFNQKLADQLSEKRKKRLSKK